MNEVDRFLRSAEWDGYQTRKRERLDEVALSAEARARKMRSKLRDLLVLIFNEEQPFERLSAICGRTAEFWKKQCTQTQGPSKNAVKLLTDGLRAHLFGLRDHLNDIERDLSALTTYLDDPQCFPRPGKKQVRWPRRS